MSDDDEEVPDFITAEGNCKYCGQKYLKKKFKGTVFCDENG